MIHFFWTFMVLGMKFLKYYPMSLWISLYSVETASLYFLFFINLVPLSLSLCLTQSWQSWVQVCECFSFTAFESMHCCFCLYFLNLFSHRYYFLLSSALGSRLVLFLWDFRLQPWLIYLRSSSFFFSLSSSGINFPLSWPSLQEPGKLCFPFLALQGFVSIPLVSFGHSLAFHKSVV